MNYNQPVEDDMLFPYVPMDVAAFLREIRSPRADDTAALAGYFESSAKEFNINPRWLIVLAEKEQSFITRVKDSSHGWQRATAYTLGYGAPDGGGDLPQYAGVENQIRLAARGLRGYLTPGHSLCVDRLVGKTFFCSDGPVIPANRASAALYTYTPWKYAAQDFIDIWNHFAHTAPESWDPAPAEPEAEGKMTVDRVEKLVVAARKQGNLECTLNGVEFVDHSGRSLLTTPGMCSAFQRVSCEAAGLGTSEFACCATATGQALRGAGKLVQGEPHPGDIMVFSGGGKCSVCGQPVGHIVCFLGDGLVAENTSSTQRGDPRPAGAKISNLSDVDPDGSRRTGVYRVEQELPQESWAAGDIVVKLNDVAYYGRFDGTDTWFYQKDPQSGERSQIKVRDAFPGLKPPAGSITPRFAESPRCCYVYGNGLVAPRWAIHWARE